LSLISLIMWTYLVVQIKGLFANWRYSSVGIRIEDKSAIWVNSGVDVWLRYVCLSVWLAQLVEALAVLTHVCSCVQEVRVRYPEQTSSTLASIPPG